jgi:hypothetical protein
MVSFMLCNVVQAEIIKLKAKTKTGGDTQGKIHRVRPDQKSPWHATISPRGTGFIRLAVYQR